MACSSGQGSKKQGANWDDLRFVLAVGRTQSYGRCRAAIAVQREYGSRAA